MDALRKLNCRPLSASLVLIFLGASLSALAHAYDHELGNAPAQVCQTCISGHVFGSASSDSAAPDTVVCTTSDRFDPPALPATSITPPRARQRAPPSPHL